ncbi:MAG: phosphatidate cytidylyltransferase [Clostridia bacterium]|nr:phosphatidate cytidylyltransferase [Clostridia bacterium]
MKKRIISGVVMGAIVALVLVFGLSLNNLILTTFVAVVAALGVNELVGNAAKIENAVIKILSAVYTVVMVFLFSNINENIYRLNLTDYQYLDIDSLIAAIVASIIYVIICAVLILVRQEEFDLAKIAVVCGMPLIYAYAFSTLASVIIATGGIYYLLLVLNFACVCDMGAYFVGVSMGKTKLCPEISPNKTVEGALGGIISSVIATLIITLCFGYFSKILPAMLITIPLCVVGMIGDLFASIIKRKVGIKDYGDLIPGHGGILDRVDSVLFIAPLVYGLMTLGVI